MVQAYTRRKELIEVIRKREEGVEKIVPVRDLTDDEAGRVMGLLTQRSLFEVNGFGALLRSPKFSQVSHWKYGWMSLAQMRQHLDEEVTVPVDNALYAYSRSKIGNLLAVVVSKEEKERVDAYYARSKAAVTVKEVQ